MPLVADYTAQQIPITENVEIYNYNCVFVYFSFQFY